MFRNVNTNKQIGFFSKNMLSLKKEVFMFKELRDEFCKKLEKVSINLEKKCWDFYINSTPENSIIIIPIKFNILINLNTYFDFVYISGKVTNNIYKNKQDEIIIN